MFEVSVEESVAKEGLGLLPQSFPCVPRLFPKHRVKAVMSDEG